MEILDEDRLRVDFQKIINQRPAIAESVVAYIRYAREIPVVNIVR